MASLTIEIPPPADSTFVFRRTFLHSIRLSIGGAQIAGEINAETAIELLRALPPAAPDERAP